MKWTLVECPKLVNEEVLAVRPQGRRNLLFVRIDVRVICDGIVEGRDEHPSRHCAFEKLNFKNIAEFDAVNAVQGIGGTSHIKEDLWDIPVLEYRPQRDLPVTLVILVVFILVLVTLILIPVLNLILDFIFSLTLRLLALAEGAHDSTGCVEGGCSEGINIDNVYLIYQRTVDADKRDSALPPKRVTLDVEEQCWGFRAE